MGTTVTFKSKNVSAVEWIQNNFLENHGSIRERILGSASVNRVVYAAVERQVLPRDTKVVYAVIYLLQYFSNRSDGRNFACKAMHEALLPFYYECPNSILELLTPTDDANANNWRQRCREANQRDELQRNAVEQLAIGSTIKFDVPLKLKHFGLFDTFCLVDRKGSLFTANGRNNFYVKLTRKRLLKGGFHVLPNTNQSLPTQTPLSL